MELVTAQQMQALDRKTIEDIGIPGVVLMENAGRGTFEHIRHYFPYIYRRNVVVLCGPGNNGGDGFVIARYFRNEGLSVTTFLMSDESRVGGDARVNMEAYKKMGGSIRTLADETAWEAVQSEIRHSGIIIDAMLGTGLSSDVRGLYRRVIEDINSAENIPVVAVDIPSGIDATTGKVLGAAIQATLTCTFALPKRGLHIFPGAEHAGHIEVIDIGIPRELVEQAGIEMHLLEEDAFRRTLPERSPESHKGTYGHVLIVAGSPGKTGAAAMAAQAAMRSGAGLVTLAVPRSLNSILEKKVTEVMTEPLPDTGEGFLGMDAWPGVEKALEGKSVLGIGPGLSDTDDTAGLVGKIVENARVPMVVDADGLNALARDPSVLKRAQAPVVLTPHPGEMARLAGKTSAQVQDARVETAAAFSKKYGAIVVLKGARTVVAEPDGRISINPTGNPGMASGGMGDVLTGLAAGLISQGIAAATAARLAVYVHGYIGDCIAREKAGIGIMATDIIERIPEILKSFIASPVPRLRGLR